MTLPSTSPPTTDVERILLVDDTPTNLQVLYQTLDGRGYELLVAQNGEEALAVAREAVPALILLDIMMPGLDGFETCRRLKSDEQTGHAAVIFMSALNEAADKVKGLTLGAVDYITKPFNAEEVVARVDTHLTIRRLRRSLEASNRALTASNQKMKRDLAAAAKVQQALLPKRSPEDAGGQFAWRYRPCDELAGDSLNLVEIDDRRMGLYVLDVSGHGVPSSLLSVTATHVLTRPRDDEAIRTLADPAAVATLLNRRFPMAEQAYHYFTMAYGVLEKQTGLLQFVCAGHPGPVVVTVDGHASSLDQPNFPVGMVEDPDYVSSEVRLATGDRVFMHSDGLLEEMNAEGEQFGKTRLHDAFAGAGAMPLEGCLDHVIDAVAAWRGDDDFTDDVTLLAYQRS